MTMSLFTLQSRCTNPTKHPLHRPSVDQTVKSKQPPIHRLLPRIPFPVPSVQPSPVEMEHVSTDPGYCQTWFVWFTLNSVSGRMTTRMSRWKTLVIWSKHSSTPTPYHPFHDYCTKIEQRPCGGYRRQIFSDIGSR